jgi:hypothetical protein
MLTPRSELGLALIDGYLYACGGSNGDVRLNSIERYSITDNKWTLVSLQIENIGHYAFHICCLDCFNASWDDKSSLLFT